MQTAIRVVHYACPLVMLLSFLCAQAFATFTLEKLKARPNRNLTRRLLWQHIFVVMTFVSKAVVMIMHSILEKGHLSSQDSIIYVLSSTLIWGMFAASLVEADKFVWYPYCISWAFSLAMETSLLALSLCSGNLQSPFDVISLSLEGLRIFMLVVMPITLGFMHTGNVRSQEVIGEEARLLAGNEAQEGGSTSNYGAINSEVPDTEDDSDAEERETKAKMMKKVEKSGNWWNYAKSFLIFWPYIWPQKDRYLQASMVLVGLCLLVERGLNVLVPRQLGIITNTLTEGGVPWIDVTLYVLFRWLDSGSGISALQSYLWMPIEQYSYRMITRAAYDHVLLLSHDFHCDKETGDLYTSVSQGRSINGFIESILFSIAPMLIDLVVAFTYFYVIFNVYMALVVALVSITYIWVTTKLGSVKNQIRRDFNKAARLESNVMWETMSSWTTVSYFNRIPYEQIRYGGAVGEFQRVERKYLIGMSLLNICQSLVFTVGLLAACFLAVYLVSTGQRQVGSFVTLLSYWVQLSQPLAFFANFYRRLQTQMLDAERLLELFQTKPTVCDKPDAAEIKDLRGDVTFENVSFAYDARKPTIQDLSFHVPAGKTVALVGETGGGKSTCLKLLFRFYDVTTGSIKVDGQDVRDVKLWDLRDNMGVVPQDPELFNTSIMSNLKYANFDASDEDVFEACRAAMIHEKILTFPDGYQSKVGERGIKLSGGELQRVAIARAILKNPKIILLDEATSMVDMDTERQIQAAFEGLTKGRTTFVVAHRLSTIMNADLIIVIANGKLVEKGSHKELLQANGRYHQLWQRGTHGTTGLEQNSSASHNLYGLYDDVESARREEILTSIRGKATTQLQDEFSKTEDNKQNCSNAALLGSSITPIVPERPVVSQTAVSFDLDPTPFRHCSAGGSRISVPIHGILKGTGSSKVAPNIGAINSRFKPDAKEFVPRATTSAKYTTYWQPQPLKINTNFQLDQEMTWLEYPSTVPIRLAWVPAYAAQTPDSLNDHTLQAKPRKTESTHLENLLKIQQKIAQALKRAEAKRQKQQENNINSIAQYVPSPEKAMGGPENPIRTDLAVDQRERTTDQQSQKQVIDRSKNRSDQILRPKSDFSSQGLQNKSSHRNVTGAWACDLENSVNTECRAAETLRSLIDKSAGKRPAHAFRSASQSISTKTESDEETSSFGCADISEDFKSQSPTLKAKTFSGISSRTFQRGTTGSGSNAEITASAQSTVPKTDQVRRKISAKWKTESWRKKGKALRREKA